MRLKNHLKLIILHLWPFWRHSKHFLNLLILHLWPHWRPIKKKIKAFKITYRFKNLQNEIENAMVISSEIFLLKFKLVINLKKNCEALKSSTIFKTCMKL